MRSAPPTPTPTPTPTLASGDSPALLPELLVFGDDVGEDCPVEVEVVLFLVMLNRWLLNWLVALVPSIIVRMNMCHWSRSTTFPVTVHCHSV